MGFERDEIAMFFLKSSLGLISEFLSLRMLINWSISSGSSLRMDFLNRPDNDSFKLDHKSTFLEVIQFKKCLSKRGDRSI